MLPFLNIIHAGLGEALGIMSLLLGLWASFSYLRNRSVSGSFRASFLLLVALTVTQGLAGLALLGLGQGPHQPLHFVYGAFAGIFLPGLYFYTARGPRQREAALLAAACWIVLVAYLRGFATGH